MALLATACGTTGSAWMEAASVSGATEESDGAAGQNSSLVGAVRPSGGVRPRQTRVIGREPEVELDEAPRAEPTPAARVLEGKSLGAFRNTYYDFPSESAFSGPLTPLMGAKCDTIKEVPRGFYEAVCVQGSGLLSGGAGTVSFARRDCECAEVCPRTGQKICFDKLDVTSFPYGRGAMGKALTPLYSVATDTSEIPMGTTLYIPEYAGLPRDEARTQAHDGCFVVQDRGLKVKGKHVDVFTGSTTMTRLWNSMVPSNRGVTVVLDSPRCQREVVTNQGAGR